MAPNGELECSLAPLELTVVIQYLVQIGPSISFVYLGAQLEDKIFSEK